MRPPFLRIGYVCAALLFVSVAAHSGQPVSKANPQFTLQELFGDGRLKIYGWIQGGFTANPDSPRDNRNFGQVLNDHANEPMLNQVGLVIERPLVPGKKEWDWGFRTWSFFGSDARFLHSLGFGDRYGDDLLQAELYDLFVLLHAPIGTDLGVDFKLGKFGTLLGIEALDPRLNFFYSHSLCALFNNPTTHTGALATVHVNPHLDLYMGVTRGVATSLDDNNSSPGFHGGFALIGICDGKVDSFCATHIGPEIPNNNRDIRFLTSWSTLYRISEKWKAQMEICHNLDQSTGAMAYGISQQITWQMNDEVSFGARAEIFRDEDNFFVGQFGNNTDAMNLLRGDPATSTRTVGGGKTTYGNLTIGMNYKPKWTPVSCAIRPEIRYDCSLNGTHPFNDSSDRDQWLLGIDLVFSF